MLAYSLILKDFLNGENVFYLSAKRKAKDRRVIPFLRPVAELRFFRHASVYAFDLHPQNQYICERKLPQKHAEFELSLKQQWTLMIP